MCVALHISDTFHTRGIHTVANTNLQANHDSMPPTRNCCPHQIVGWYRRSSCPRLGQPTPEHNASASIPAPEQLSDRCRQPGQRCGRPLFGLATGAASIQVRAAEVEQTQARVRARQHRILQTPRIECTAHGLKRGSGSTLGGTSALITGRRSQVLAKLNMRTLQNPSDEAMVEESHTTGLARG